VSCVCVCVFLLRKSQPGSLLLFFIAYATYLQLLYYCLALILLFFTKHDGICFQTLFLRFDYLSPPNYFHPTPVHELLHFLWGFSLTLAGLLLESKNQRSPLRSSLINSKTDTFVYSILYYLSERHTYTNAIITVLSLFFIFIYYYLIVLIYFYQQIFFLYLIYN